MIKVFRDRSAHRVTISGHAGFAPKGEDLVCAGVTTLALTLAHNVRALEERGAAGSVRIQVEDGAADISCSPVPGYGALVEVVYDTICMGLADMAEANPTYCQYFDR